MRLADIPELQLTVCGSKKRIKIILKQKGYEITQIKSRKQT